MKSNFVFLYLLFFVSAVFAQETTETEDNSLKGQFDKIYRTSTTYQTYKVISKDKYEQLKKNVLDSIAAANKSIAIKENQLKREQTNLAKLNAEVNRIKKELGIALKKENSIALFGMQLSKVTYNIILWALILILTLSLGFFIFKFSRSNILTKKAQENLIDVEHEFESHRKKSLEREQKLRRQLQDEINKHRNF